MIFLNMHSITAEYPILLEAVWLVLDDEAGLWHKWNVLWVEISNKF